MHLLIDEDLPRSVGTLLLRYHHQVTDVRDIGLRGVNDAKIATYAQENELCLITGDLGFSDIRNYPPEQYHGIIILRLPSKATAFDILRLLESFIEEAGIIDQLKGKLAIVEKGRVRIRKG